MLPPPRRCYHSLHHQHQEFQILNHPHQCHSSFRLEQISSLSNTSTCKQTILCTNLLMSVSLSVSAGDLGDQLLLWPVSVVSVSVSSSGVLTQGGGRPEPEQRRINQSPLSVTISAAWASSDQSQAPPQHSIASLRSEEYTVSTSGLSLIW